MNFKRKIGSMLKLNKNCGKFGIKQIVITVIFVAFALMVGCHMPLVARYAHSKIKIGMSANEVKSSLSGLGQYHLYCETDKDEKDNAIFDDDKCFELILTLPNQQEIKSVKMSVLFMGPVFWHNDFFITFGKDGKVNDITPVRGWD